MVTTLSPVEPDVEFFDLEPIICDADNMVDVLGNLVLDQFEGRCPADGYRISAEDGARLFFLAGLALAMSRKAKDAWYIAHTNSQERRKC